METIVTTADKEEGHKRIIRDYKGTEKEIMSEKDKGKNNPNVNIVKINKIYESGNGCKTEKEMSLKGNRKVKVRAKKCENKVVRLKALSE